jgi:metallo-beta-lactamase class B
MKRMFRKSLLWSLCHLTLGLMVAGPAFAQAVGGAKAPSLTALPPGAKLHLDAAKSLIEQGLPRSAIGDFFTTLGNEGLVASALLPPPNPPTHPADRSHLPVVTPSKAFDNLYYIGNIYVGSWVLVTPDGIIQWDSMDNDDEAQNIIEAGYKTLGLDPARIKYIILTHGHGDHFGGVSYFTRKYPNIHVLSADWDLMNRTLSNGGRMGPAPAFRAGVDMAVTDGQRLSLGGTTVTLYVTPGHTPGTVSAIFPVMDHAAKHVAAMFGGFGLPVHLAATDRDSGLDTYEKQFSRFAAAAKAAHADSVVSTHPDFDGTAEKIEKNKLRGARDPSPWILGSSGFDRFVRLVHEACAASRAIIVAAAAASPGK